MIAGALSQAEAPLLENVAAAQAALDRHAAERDAGAAAAEAAAQCAADHGAKVGACESALQAANATVEAAKSALHEAQEAQRCHDSELQAATAEKETCEAAVRDHLGPLRGSVWEGDGDFA